MQLSLYDSFQHNGYLKSLLPISVKGFDRIIPIGTIRNMQRSIWLGSACRIIVAKITRSINNSKAYTKQFFSFKDSLKLDATSYFITRDQQPRIEPNLYAHHSHSPFDHKQADGAILLAHCAVRRRGYNIIPASKFMINEIGRASCRERV